MDEAYNNLRVFSETWMFLHEGKLPKIEPFFVKSKLDSCYKEEGRYYHTITHINDGLLELDSARHLIKEPSEVEIAWYSHDAVYNTRKKNNEERSQELICGLLEKSGVSQERTNRIGNLIYATKHFEAPKENDAQILLDVDLSILGKPEEEFNKYEKNTRKEYSWVPKEQFRIGRKVLLEKFLSRPTIYSTDFFRNKYEKRARENLAMSISRLSKN